MKKIITMMIVVFMMLGTAIAAPIRGGLGNNIIVTASTVTTVAGTGGFGSIDGPAATATFAFPTGIATDQYGNIFVADELGHAIRKIDAQGNVTTIAGTAGKPGTFDGLGILAWFSNPDAIGIDQYGNIFVADRGNNRIRKIDVLGNVTTLAGGVKGFTDGTAVIAQFSQPYGLAVDLYGNVFVGDTFNHRVRKIDALGNVTTLAGTGVAGFTNGVATIAQFNTPVGVAVDQYGNVLVADQNNNAIRKIDTQGNVTTLAGTGLPNFTDGVATIARFNSPVGVAVDQYGNIFVGDAGNHSIRKIDAQGNVTTLAGTGVAGFADGSGAIAQFDDPQRLTFDQYGDILVVERRGNRVRKVTLVPIIDTQAPVGTRAIASGFIRG